MTEVATFLKVGAMSIVLDMVEDNWPLPAVELEDPVLAIKTVSRDLAVKGDLKLAGGRTPTAIPLQRAYPTAAQDLYPRHGLTLPGKGMLGRRKRTPTNFSALPASWTPG